MKKGIGLLHGKKRHTEGVVEDQAITVSVKEVYGEKRIIGKVDGDDVIAIGFFDGEVTIRMSSCLPVNFVAAMRYVECMRVAIDQALTSVEE